ncbi:MAG: DUF368 domain-containing protein [Planctomycetota bacterium]
MTQPANDKPSPLLAVRALLGGTLMGLANLVPGISGGTMLLAAGIYTHFINAIGELTTLKFRKASLLVLGCVVAAAFAAIVLLAEPVKDLVIHHRWVMYSLFIGLTLGGVPVVWRLIGKPTKPMWVATALGFLGMTALAVAQMLGTGDAANEGFLFMLLAGLAGAAAMILPGVSGGYLLLVLGVYVPILAAIASFKDALKATDTDVILSIGTGVILPVGLGVILGIALVSNALKLLLAKFPKPTLGVLLGLLLGAVVGLYPFQQGVAPTPGQTFKAQTVALDADQNLILQETGKPIDPEDYPTATFTPTATQVAASLGLILAGFLLTLGIDSIGKDRKAKR